MEEKSCVTPAGTSTSLTSSINGMATYTHTHTRVMGQYRTGVLFHHSRKVLNNTQSQVNDSQLKSRRSSSSPYSLFPIVSQPGWDVCLCPKQCMTKQKSHRTVGTRDVIYTTTHTTLHTNYLLYYQVVIYYQQAV